MKQLAVFGSCIAIAAGAAFAPGKAHAESDLSYTYLEGDYLNLDIDLFDDDEEFLEEIDDGDGWAVRGSLALSPHFFGFGDYSVTDSDATFIDDNDVIIISNQDVKRLNVGLGLNIPIFQGGTDFVARAAYTDVDFGDFNVGGSDSIDIDDLNEDESDGFFVDGGLRSQLTDRIEGGIGVRYMEIEDADDTSVFGNLMFELTPALGINLAVDAGDTVSTYMVGLRYSFNSY